jgi:hypothetical protein
MFRISDEKGATLGRTLYAADAFAGEVEMGVFSKSDNDGPTEH